MQSQSDVATSADGVPVVADLSSATRKELAIDALEATMSNNRNLRAGLDEITAPVKLIDSSYWRPTNREAAARRGIEPLFGVAPGSVLATAPPLRAKAPPPRSSAPLHRLCAIG